MIPNKTLQWPILWAAVLLIAEREGCKLTAYLCPAGVWTLGWGETRGVKKGMVWTQSQADEKFCESLREFTDEVLEMCEVKPTAAQLGAMVSLAYNIGLGAFAGSSVLRLHNTRASGVGDAFKRWNKATVGGKLVVLAGLTTRRAAEAALYTA